MGSGKSKAIVYLIISAVVIILIKLWLHYTSWLPIATIRAEKQARAVCKEYVLTCLESGYRKLLRMIGVDYGGNACYDSAAFFLEKITLLNTKHFPTNCLSTCCFENGMISF